MMTFSESQRCRLCDCVLQAIREEVEWVESTGNSYTGSPSWRAIITLDVLEGHWPALYKLTLQDLLKAINVTLLRLWIAMGYALNQRDRTLIQVCIDDFTEEATQLVLTATHRRKINE